MSDIRFVGDMERLEIRETDRFVLKVSSKVTMETAERLQETWKTFSEGKCGSLLILEPGMELGVISTTPEKD